MTSAPRSTTCDDQRDRFGNKGSLLDGRLVRAGPETVWPAVYPLLGLSHTMGHKRGNILKKAARLRFLSIKHRSQHYTELYNIILNIYT